VADALDAALRQLAEHGERLAALDQREARHARAAGERLAELATLVAGLGEAVRGQASVLTRVQALDEQVAYLSAQLTGTHPGDGDGEGEGRQYRPGPAPRWWKLAGHEREQAAGRLAGWVEQVYRPGYGQLAAALGPCWAAHPLCLYALDIAAELWSVLYLQPARTPAVLSAQAEYQARILPALAAHAKSRPTKANTPRSALSRDPADTPWKRGEEPLGYSRSCR
jgi:hypothetical protein